MRRPGQPGAIAPAVSRRALLALPLLGAACGDLPDDAPPARFASALEQASAGSAVVIGRMDAFETLARRETDAIAFANGDRRLLPKAGPPEPGLAADAGQVIGAAFIALGAYAHTLSMVATGHPPMPTVIPPGEVLVGRAQQGLARLRQRAGIVVPPAVQSAGLQGIAALTALPQRVAAELRPRTAALVAEADPSVAAVAALLDAVIDPPTGGLRSALRGKREGFDQEADRFLNRLSGDRRLGPGDRYMLYRSVAAVREDDPAPGTLAAFAALAAAMRRAHAALAGPLPAAEAEVGAFEARVAQLSALAESSRRRDPPPENNAQPLR